MATAGVCPENESALRTSLVVLPSRCVGLWGECVGLGLSCVGGGGDILGCVF